MTINNTINLYPHAGFLETAKRGMVILRDCHARAGGYSFTLYLGKGACGTEFRGPPEVVKRTMAYGNRIYTLCSAWRAKACEEETEQALVRWEETLR